MANYDGNVIELTVLSGIQGSAPANIIDVEVLLGWAYPITIPPPDIIQRIWDTTAGWCQYTQQDFDPAPDPGDTEPNHTGNLVVGTHQVLGEIE
jgi:hypothetical protein